MYAAPDVVGCFEDGDVAPRAEKLTGSRQAGYTGTDYNDVDCTAQRERWLLGTGFTVVGNRMT